MDALLERIRQAGVATGRDGTWLALCEYLLERCRDERQTFHAAFTDDDDEAHELLADVIAQAGALLPRATSQVHPQVAADLDALLRSHVTTWHGLPEATPVLLARALAVAIDQCLHHVLRQRLRSDTPTILTPGRIYPVHRYDLFQPTRLIQGGANTHPGTIADDPSCLPHFRLAGPVAGEYRVELDWTTYGRLAALTAVKLLRIAVCQPNLSIDDFDLDLSADPPTPKFDNHGPLPADQVDALVQQLDAAVERGAQVVLFPEYTVGLEHRGPLLQRVEEHAAAAVATGRTGPVVVVAGSSRVEASPGEPYNEACVWLPDGAPVALRKCIPARVGGYVENIGSGDRTLRVLMGERWAVAVLVCRDALDRHIIAQLEELGVNLCLVPAMSPTTTRLVEFPCRLASGSQAFVAVGVTPAVWGNQEQSRVQAAFHGPYEGPVGPVCLPEESEPAARRRVWVFDAFDRTIDHVQVP